MKKTLAFVLVKVVALAAIGAVLGGCDLTSLGGAL